MVGVALFRPGVLLVDSDVHICVVDVGKSFDNVDRGVLDCVLSSLGLLAWFRHVLFSVSCPC